MNPFSPKEAIPQNLMDAFQTKQDPALTYLLSRLQDAQSRLGRLHEAGHKLGDRVFGAIPEAIAGCGKGPTSDGMISMLHLVVDDIHARITDCEGDMQRLQGL